MITRFKMAGLHFLASAVVVGFFMSLIYFIWYPYPFYIFHSTISATKLVVLVDLALGPLLTFVVFNKTKPAKELKRDLSIIVLFQVLALSWGVYVTHSVRPSFVVYFNGEISSITSVSYDGSGFDKPVTEPGIFEPPKMVYLEKFSKEEMREMLEKIMTGRELAFALQTSRYRYFDNEAKKDMISRSLTKEQLTTTDYRKKTLNEYLSTHKVKFDDVLFYPVSAGPYNSTAILDKHTLQIIDYLDMVVSNSSEY